MVFDRWDVALASVTHLVNEGILDFYIVDHRSSGNPQSDFLSRVPESARIHWFRKESPYFAQTTTMTALAHMARQDGFAAFIPFDSDEFFVGNGMPLLTGINNWLSNSATRALRAEMVNFFQSSDVEVFTPETLARVRYRAVRGELPLEYLVGYNPTFRRFPFARRAHKIIMRLVPGIDGDSDWLTTGNHRVRNMLTGDVYPADDSASVSVLHLPFVSAQGIVARQGNPIRLPTGGGLSLDTKGQEFSMEDDHRLAEWAMASAPAGSTEAILVIGGVTAEYDERLARLSSAIVSAIRPRSSNPVPAVDATARIASIGLDLAMVATDLISKSQKGKSAGALGGTNAKHTLQSHRRLEKRVEQLQAKVDEMRPNLLRLIMRKFLGR